MKKRIITLSLLTLATVAAGAVVDIKPAMAQGRGARFDFEPNRWGAQQFEKRQYRNFNPPTTSVGHGSVPKASTFLGIDPSVLKPAPKPQPVQPMVATNVHPSMSFGQPQAKIVPKPMTPAAFNPGFGAPMQNTPVVAQQLPAPVPQQLANPSSNRSLSGRMVPKRSGNSHSRNAVAGRMMKPKQPSGLSAQPKIASYGNQFFSPGSTKPTSSGFSSKSDVYGQIINHHK
jgi:hypothetical protein